MERFLWSIDYGTILSKPRWSSSDKISIFVVFECLLFRIFFSSSRIFLWLKFLKFNEFIPRVWYSKEFQNYFFQEFCFFSEKKRWMPKLRGFYNSSPNSFSSLFAFEPFFVTFNWDSSLANESTLFFGLFFFGPFRFRRFPPPIAVNYFSFLLPQRIMTS